MSIKPPSLALRGHHRTLKCQLKLPTSIQLLHIIIEETEAEKQHIVSRANNREGGEEERAGNVGPELSSQSTALSVA